MYGSKLLTGLMFAISVLASDVGMTSVHPNSLADASQFKTLPVYEDDYSMDFGDPIEMFEPLGAQAGPTSELREPGQGQTSFSSMATPADTTPADASRSLIIPHKLKIAVTEVEPFIIKEGDVYTGFSVLLWDKIAKKLDIDYEFYDVDASHSLMDELSEGRADMAFGGITISSDKAKNHEFSQPYFTSGQKIMIARKDSEGIEAITSNIALLLFSPQILKAILFLGALMFLSANAVWFFERKTNKDMFPNHYFRGVMEAMWWSAVTVTTVGYGDKTPKSKTGRVFALIWMFTGIFLISFFTATVSSSLTLSKIKGDIHGVEDLIGKQIGTLRGSPANTYLSRKGVRVFEYDDIERAYLGAKKGLLSAVVYDSAILHYYVANVDNGQFKLVGNEFMNKHYGFAFPKSSPLVHDINVELLEFQENGVYDRLHKLWFGE